MKSKDLKTFSVKIKSNSTHSTRIKKLSSKAIETKSLKLDCKGKKKLPQTISRSNPKFGVKFLYNYPQLMTKPNVMVFILINFSRKPKNQSGLILKLKSLFQISFGLDRIKFLMVNINFLTESILMTSNKDHLVFVICLLLFQL